jgi:2-polyprenyl-3-methyl-5-hydroxy-6-metoxy-1,4-benzoquinol methylase
MIPDSYIDRFATKKYRSKNRIKRRLIRNFIDELHSLFVAANPAQRVLEVGVGEGFISGYLSERFPEKEFVGVDINAEDIAKLREKFPKIEAHTGNIYNLSFLEGEFDIVICAEVLEHLDEPQRGLEQIAKLNPKRCIFTVPHEPWFMLSNLAIGKNISRFGNDPEHINHFRQRSLRRLLSKQFEVLEQSQSYPWLLALTRPR